MIPSVADVLCLGTIELNEVNWLNDLLITNSEL